MQKFLKKFFLALITFALFFVFAPNIVQASSVKPVIFYGDPKGNVSNHKKIVAGIEAQNPKIVFNTGDLVSYKYSIYDWTNFAQITKNLRATTRYLPAIGNHEAYTSYFTQLFSLPRGGRYYSTTYRKLYFIVLDSNASFKYDTRQYRFLKDSLVRARRLHRTIIVIFHHPPIASDGGENNPKYLLPLFKKYRVRMVFNGHYHYYERSYYNKTHYIVTGGGGATLSSREQKGPYSRKYVKTYHFCKLDLKKDNMWLSVYDRDGNLIDYGRMSYSR